MEKFQISRSMVLILTVAFAMLVHSSPWAEGKDFAFVSDSEAAYWPTTEWLTSTPEKQGMGSHVLSSLMAEINRNNEPINSVLIIRNGYIVAEANKSDNNELHPLWSSTKSITSALIGIALQQNIIRSIDQPLSDFFKNGFQIGGQPGWSAPTVGHLLTMSSGMDWPELESGSTEPINPIYQMHTSENWVETILNRKLIHEPGRRFNYSSGGSHLLLALLARRGLDVEQFASENLFQPLGISPGQYRWSKDPEGIPNGSHGLVMKPRDMAKFGYLYLKEGGWDGRQIIDKQWVVDSTKRHISINWGGHIANHYGYQWYIQPYGFHSMGHFGQYIFVLPNHNVVAIFTSELAKHELEVPIKLVGNYLDGASYADHELPEDKNALERLAEQIAIFDN